MKQILTSYLNKTVEINYGGTATVKGELVDIIDNVVKLKALDETFLFIPIEKIHVFWEVKDKEKPVGFVYKPSPTKE
ncbi:MAG: MM0924 family protein [Acidobacteriota bacterium]|nr:hypothetical protein [Blastocatellia bacterium]MDW8240205.1 MM0924 family protein [Acidobacteriota bacterium]